MNERLSAALADRYLIERELGAGGMATVYLARDIRHERQVAIKVLREDLSASLGSGRFLREIKIAAQLQHPNILPLLDSGEEGGFLYFVMPWIKGQSLRERLTREGELPVHEAVRLVTQVVDALVHAHEHGVVHRDIKPDNVMLSGRHALVTDFGVAKAISEATGRSTVTTLGVALGTPMYMSPEQAAADPHVDHRSDIYSVGVMAYEMLSGRPPFTAPTPQQILAAHVTEVPDPVSKRRQAIPAAVEAVVMKCLEKRPADRYQTSSELLAALEPLATPSTGITPTHTRPIGRAGGSRARRMIAGTAAIVVLAGGAYALKGTTGAAIDVSPLIAQTTSSGDVAHASISPDGTRIAYGRRRCEAGGRCLYDVVVQDVGGAGTLVVASGMTTVYSIVEWSSDGRFLLVNGAYSPQWGTYLVPTSVQAPPQLLGPGTRFLTNSDTIITARLSVPGDSGEWMKVMTVADRRVHDSTWIAYDYWGGREITPSPDGKRSAIVVAYQGRRRLMRMLERDGTITDSLAMDGIAWVRWLPGGRSLLFTLRAEGGANLFHVVQARFDGKGRFASVDTIWRRAQLTAGEIDITRDGKMLVLTQGPMAARLVAMRRTPNTAQFSQRVLATATTLMGGGISPDGRMMRVMRVITAGSELTKVQLSVMPSDSGAEVIASPLLDSLFDVGWVKQSGSGIWYAVRGGPDSKRLEAFDIASQRRSALGTVVDPQLVNGVVHLATGRILIFDHRARMFILQATDKLPERRIPYPAGLALIGTTAHYASGTEFLAAGWDAKTQDSLAIYRVNLNDGTSKHVASRPADGLAGLDVLENGDILASLSETGETVTLYRIPANGKWERVGQMPYGAQVTFTMARDGLKWAAMVNEPRLDVWLVKNLDRMIRK